MSGRMYTEMFAQLSLGGCGGGGNLDSFILHLMWICLPASLQLKFHFPEYSIPFGITDQFKYLVLLPEEHPGNCTKSSETL